jgi:hypothetical protein
MYILYYLLFNTIYFKHSKTVKGKLSLSIT